MSARTQKIRADVPLIGHVDAEERFARFPSSYLIKGMFFNRMIAIGGTRAYAEVARQLVKHPPLGRYLPFGNYPQVDFSRLAHHVAVARAPRLDVVEAMRRLARHDITAFAESTVGSVMLTLAGNDPKTALLKLPDMYRASLVGGSVAAKELGADTIELAYEDFYGWLDCYPIGHIEGLVEHCGWRCEIEVAATSEIAAVLRVALARA